MVDFRIGDRSLGRQARRADHGDQHQRQQAAEPGRLRRRGVAAIQRDHDAGVAGIGIGQRLWLMTPNGQGFMQVGN